jgi:hypothetical protein
MMWLRQGIARLFFCKRWLFSGQIYFWLRNPPQERFKSKEPAPKKEILDGVNLEKEIHFLRIIVDFPTKTV